MACLAHENPTIFRVHARVQENQTAIQMFNFAVTTGVRSSGYLHNVTATNLILIGVQGDGIAILASLLQSRRFAFNHLSVHSQNVKVLALQTNDDANGLWTDDGKY